MHHCVEGTNISLAEDVTIEGKVGKSYETKWAVVDSDYEHCAEPVNRRGKMTETPIEVTYYYRLKTVKYRIYHREMYTEKELDIVALAGIEKIEGTIGTDAEKKQNLRKGKEEYRTKTKTKVEANKYIRGDIYGYKYVKSSVEEIITKANEVENVIVIYYELKEGKVVVHHYLEDMEGNLTENRLAEDVEIKGKVFSEYKTKVREGFESRVGDNYEFVKTVRRGGDGARRDAIVLKNII